MKITQAYEILNGIVKETIGDSLIVAEDLSNIVDIGNAFNNLDLNDKYLRNLINRIGKVIFVDRPYQGQAPSIMRTASEYGSIIQKIRADLPETKSNDSWALVSAKDGGGNNLDTKLYLPEVHSKFFNEMITFDIPMSFMEIQLKQSFESANQLVAFYSMIENRISMRRTMDYDNLIMRTLNTMICGTVASSFDDISELGGKTSIKAVNLLYEYKQATGDNTVTKANCLFNLNFIKFASYRMGLYSDRLQKASSLFNVGETVKFTPKSLQHFVLLSEFEKAANVYLQSDTFHNEFTRLPKAETVAYWQGSGRDYEFDNTSKIHAQIMNPNGDNNKIEVAIDGVLGCIFDHDACAVANVYERVKNVPVPNAEYYTNFYKTDARYLVDYDENFIVFYVEDDPS